MAMLVTQDNVIYAYNKYDIVIHGTRKYLHDQFRYLGEFMNKVRISLRLDNALVKCLDAKKTKTKNRSDVIVELLYAAIAKDTKVDSTNKYVAEIDRHKLQEQAAKASLFTMRMLELFLKLPDEKGVEVCKKALANYKKDLQLLEPEAQTESEIKEFL